MGSASRARTDGRAATPTGGGRQDGTAPAAPGLRVLAANQKWVSDVTEFNVGGVKQYYSPIIDLHDLAIIAGSLGQHPTTNLTNASLRHAVGLPPEEGPALMVRTDQGFE